MINSSGVESRPTLFGRWFEMQREVDDPADTSLGERSRGSKDCGELMRVLLEEKPSVASVTTCFYWGRLPSDDRTTCLTQGIFR